LTNLDYMCNLVAEMKLRGMQIPPFLKVWEKKLNERLAIK
jgi:hypothetical protein